MALFFLLFFLIATHGVLFDAAFVLVLATTARMSVRITTEEVSG